MTQGYDDTEETRRQYVVGLGTYMTDDHVSFYFPLSILIQKTILSLLIHGP